MDFSSDVNANFEGLLAVNRGFCMTQKSVCRNQRYNTLDFAEQNRVPAGMLPLQSLIFFAGAYANCKRQLALPALKMQKKQFYHTMRAW